MKTYQKYVWFLLLLVFILNQLLERVLHIHVSFLHSYLDDFLAIPILLGMYQITMKQLNKNVTITKYMVVLAVIMLSVHFELIMPIISANYTADVYDVLMYVAGATLYALVFNIKKKQTYSI